MGGETRQFRDLWLAASTPEAGAGRDAREHVPLLEAIREATSRPGR